METNGNRRLFPCPVCTEPREVRLTRKNKPYVVCDPCGIQLFVRGPAGIDGFNRLVERAGKEDLWSQLANMEPRYHLKCAECGTRFWAELKLVKTSLFDGSFRGFRCPKCGTTVEWERKP